MEKLPQNVMDRINPVVPGAAIPGQEIIQQGGTMQRVDTGYTTAVSVQKPRSIAVCAAAVLEEAKLAGKSFFFRWPVKNHKVKGGKHVQGGSIDLALCIARNFMNCAVDVQTRETLTHDVFDARFIDIETGFTLTRVFQQRKSQNTGMKDKERGADLIFQVGQSKAIRNVILNYMPNWIIDKAVDVARAAEIADIKPENLAISRAQVLEHFQAYGIDKERLEAKAGRKVDDWTVEDVADFRGDASALKNGTESASVLFPEVFDDSEPVKMAEPLKNLEKYKAQVDADPSIKKGVMSEREVREQNKQAADTNPSAKDESKPELKYPDTLDSKWATFRSNWIKLRNQTMLMAFYKKNLDLFLDAPEKLRSEAEKKFEKSLGRPAPWVEGASAEDTKGEPENVDPGATEVQESKISRQLQYDLDKIRTAHPDVWGKLSVSMLKPVDDQSAMAFISRADKIIAFKGGGE